jgi:integrase
VARPKREVPWLGLRNGIYQAFWYEPATRETRRCSLGTKDSGEAQARFAAFLVEGDAITQPRLPGLTTEQAIDDYLREHVRKNCANPRRQEDAARHLVEFFGGTPIHTIDIPRSRAYADARRAGTIGTPARRSGKSSKVGDSTIRRELTVLTAAANHAVAWKRLKEMPSVELPYERRLGQDDEALYYTKPELDALMTMADGELFHYIVLAYWTGARRASIEELTRPQVKFDQKQILLQKPGKRATKKRQPIVPILKEMRPTLDALMATGRERLFSVADFFHPYRKLCFLVGIDEKRAHPHILRHTRATHLLQKGVSLHTVARLLGDTLATVDRVYGHHSATAVAEEIDGL